MLINSDKSVTLPGIYENGVFLREDVWSTLKNAKKPIVLYGMGDGAVKIYSVLQNLGVTPAAIMASDDFVRGHSFLGYTVRKLSEIKEMYQDFFIVVCFGTSKTDVMERILELSKTYDVVLPDVPVTGEGLFDQAYIKNNIVKIDAVRRMLSDETSVSVFNGWLNYRYTGNIQYLYEIQTDKKEAFQLLELSENETYLDLGAYTGDTVDEFLRTVDLRFEHIYAVEPDVKNYTKMLRRLYHLGNAIFTPVNAAVWNVPGEIPFSQRAGRNSAVGNEKRVKIIPAVSVDSLLKGNKATLIKMDVEGSEKQAIEGAVETIKKHRPKMIVSLYHRNEDMVELPLLLKELCPGYHFYLRHHPYFPAWDTNLYCVPRRF
jgi:FkbM family methyltransferase